MPGRVAARTSTRVGGGDRRRARTLRVVRTRGARPLTIALGAVVGALTAVLGTVVHGQVVVLSGMVVPSGLLIAVVTIAAADLALAVAVPRPSTLIASGAGRAAVLVAAITWGPGGDLLVAGGGTGEVWLAVAVLLPAFGSPLLSAWSVRQRRDLSGQSSARVGPGDPGRRTTLARTSGP